MPIKTFTAAPLTRPNDTNVYASGDLVGNSTASGAANVAIAIPATPLKKGGAFRIKRVRIAKGGAVLTNASFRVHFYRTPPTFSNADNGVWLTTQSDYLGSVDITVDRAFATGSIGVASLAANADIIGTLQNNRFIYAAIEARAAYTPIALETFTLTTWADIE